MAELDSKSSYPFAGSFFSANPPSPSTPFRIMPRASLVLHLNGEMETFCVQAHRLLIRPNTDREKAQLLSYHRELSCLVESMGRRLRAAHSP